MMRKLIPFVLLALSCTTTGQKKKQVAVDKATADTVAKTETTNDAARHFAEGTQELKTDKNAIQKARTSFEAALKADPSLSVANYNLGVIAEKEGRIDDAVKYYRAAFDNDSRLDLAVNNLGVILESNGQRDDAVALYQEAIERNPETVHGRIRLARLAVKDGDAKTAARLAREALSFDGKSIEAYRMLARLYAEKRKNTLARLIAVRGQKLVEGDAELTYALAVVAKNEKKVAIARELLRRVIEKDPTHVDARVALAELALANRDWQTATTELLALSKQHNKNVTVWTLLGLAYKGQGKFAEAEQAYETAISIDPNYAPAILNVGILHLRSLDNPEAAKVKLERYLDISSNNTKKVVGLVQEADILIEAKAEEARAMEQAKIDEAAARALEAEEAAKAKAEAEAKAIADAEDKAAAEKKAAEAPVETKAAAAKEVEEAPVQKKPVKKRPKKRPKKKKKKVTKPKASPKAPDADEDFFD